jgi:xanthine dehydrogenase molybdenum-binding subunit
MQLSAHEEVIQMNKVGRSEVRIDAFDKATGRTRYYEDRVPPGALYARIKHAEKAHALVKSVDTAAALAIPGVLKVLTCFDVPDIPFPTAGHPWSMDPGHQDVADRHLLNRHVRYWGDDVAVVIAENEVAAMQGVRALTVEYEELPFVLDVQKAMEPGAPQLHEGVENNILKHTSSRLGDYQSAITEEGLIQVEGWYETPTVQHCHIENHGCFAYEENGRIVVVTSTQIPHIIRRVVGQALGRPWADIQIIKPYIGGGFGNKQDALYEPLCAWCCTQMNGRCVRIDCSREETFVSNRVRHAIRFHIVSWLRRDGSIAARKVELFSNQGAYASHGHSIAAKGMGSFAQHYPCSHMECDSYTVYTNRPAAGAMRGYGMPQASFADEANIDDCAAALGMDPLEFRRKNIMPQGFHDNFSGNTNYYDTYRQCMSKGAAYIDYARKRAEYAGDTGPVRRGIGVATFWYNTGVYPISLETSSNRMLLNLDGTVTFQCGETEIGQGADTAYAQMVAQAVGLKSYRDVRVVSCQDTDITPVGLGAYASRQTYMESFSIRQTADLLRQKILDYAKDLTELPPEEMDVVDGTVVRKDDGKALMDLRHLAMTAQYNPVHSEHITAESTYTIRSNAYSFGCTFAEVEVDIPLCKVTLKNIVNVHDCGNLINPALAEAQVHGGMSMAIGYGLSEQLLFDEKTGRPLNNNLLDYKLSTFMDHPHLEAQFVENPEPTSPFGTKALGEPPACSGAPAIRNAILHATGVAIDRIPINPHVLFAEFSRAGLIQDD